MASKHAERISDSLARVGRYSDIASKALKIFLAVYLVLAIPISCYLTGSIVVSGLNLPDLLWMSLQLLPIVLSIAVTALVLATLRLIFADISVGGSPFTDEHSRRLFLIGWLLVASFIFGAVASVAPMPYAQIGSLTFGFFVPSADPSGISFDFSSIMWAVVCFCFSYAFKYGALLQQLSDDTI